MNKPQGVSSGEHLNRRGLLRCATALACGFARAVFGQIAGNLAGIVTDPTGDAIPNAEVQATNRDTGVTMRASTDASGRFTFGNLQPGTYDLSVSSPGFAMAKMSGVQVLVAQTAIANVPLSIGTVEVPNPATVENAMRLTARDFLISDHEEEPGYGLYSYMLFGRRPTDATRERYLALISEYLALEQVSNFKKVSRNRLNITYMPLTERPNSSDSEKVLANYDFARAEDLLSHVPEGPHVDGPYIVSWQGPLTRAKNMPRHGYLFEDLSPVPPQIVALWVREFQIQASQTEYWKSRNGPQAALKLRTAIAQLAAGIDPTKKSVTEWQAILVSLIAWKSGGN